ncbi:signal peptidase I [Silvibacterium acidisoli]|uniref:signal peptidase I n=1 Tax=Acidobacteriaceae bacterium ZG23-2 TaxID=2883246 RepID=UPI00406C56E7
MEKIIENKRSAKSKSDETPLEGFASICGVLVLGLFALTFIFQNFSIPSSSMENTLLIGDHVVVDRTVFAPRTPWAPFLPYHEIHRGDIIVFFKPRETGLYLVKRVIGLPGDRIHLVNGTVYLNGKPQVEPQAVKAKPDDEFPYRDEFPVVAPPPQSEVTAEWALALPNYVHNGDLVVPPGNYFAMGDNRPVSLDGRFWGFVPRANIVGTPLFVYWSFITPDDQFEKTGAGDRIGFTLHTILHFFDQTRWSRTLHRVK